MDPFDYEEQGGLIYLINIAYQPLENVMLFTSILTCAEEF